MKISIISDIHAAPYNKSGNETLKKFLNNEEVLKSDVVIFLGDIFDVMFGCYNEYLSEEKEFFDWVKKNQSSKSIHFVEGNHDFHLEKFFKKIKLKLTYHKKGFDLQDSGRRFYFEHGDDIEIDNSSYRKYKSFVRSGFMKRIAENATIPYKMLKATGKKVTLRNKNIETKYSKNAESEIIKEKFRVSYLNFKDKNKYDVVVCGHGHIKDHFQSNGRTYINNGYAPHSNTFILINNGEPRFVELKQSQS